MSEAEAERLAAEEGLSLVLSSNNRTGYVGVFRVTSRKAETYGGQITEGGKLRALGSFSSVHEAGLAYARALGPERSTKAAADAGKAKAPPTARPVAPSVSSPRKRTLAASKVFDPAQTRRTVERLHGAKTSSYSAAKHDRAHQRESLRWGAERWGAGSVSSRMPVFPAPI